VSGEIENAPKGSLAVTKPYSGFYDRRLRLSPSKHSQTDRAITGAPTNQEDGGDTSETLKYTSRSHSAPGIHQEIATRLIQRAKRVMPQVTNPEDALQVAVLASVASDLLERKSVHLALDALSIQNRMEVK